MNKLILILSVNINFLHIDTEEEISASPETGQFTVEVLGLLELKPDSKERSDVTAE